MILETNSYSVEISVNYSRKQWEYLSDMFVYGNLIKPQFKIFQLLTIRITVPNSMA